MGASFRDQQEAYGFNVAGIEAMKRAVLAGPVTVLKDDGTTSVVTLEEASKLGSEILEACNREKMYRPCGDLCGTRPCPPASSHICYVSTDTFSCDCKRPGACSCKQEALDQFEAVHGDAYHDYSECNAQGIPAERGFYLPPYNHLKPADFMD